MPFTVQEKTLILFEFYGATLIELTQKWVCRVRQNLLHTATIVSARSKTFRRPEILAPKIKMKGFQFIKILLNKLN